MPNSPAVPRDASHAPRGRVVHGAPQHDGVRSPAGPPAGRARLGGRDTRDTIRTRPERRVAHSERDEQPLRGEDVERHPAHPPDDRAEQEEVEIAVDETLARRRLEAFREHAPQRLVGSLELLFERQVGP